MKKILVFSFLLALVSCGTSSKDSGGKKIATKSTSKNTTKASSKSLSSSSSYESASCKLENDVRSLKVVDISGAACGVEYTKWGETKEIGVAENDRQYCSDLLNRVRSNLETAGFDCI